MNSGDPSTTLVVPGSLTLLALVSLVSFSRLGVTALPSLFHFNLLSFSSPAHSFSLLLLYPLCTRHCHTEVNVAKGGGENRLLLSHSALYQPSLAGNPVKIGEARHVSTLTRLKNRREEVRRTAPTKFRVFRLKSTFWDELGFKRRSKQLPERA